MQLYLGEEPEDTGQKDQGGDSISVCGEAIICWLKTLALPFAGEGNPSEPL